MRVLNLEVHNVQRISHVNFDMEGQSLFIVGGKNKQGKCVPEGSLVALWDGSRKPIEDIRETDVLVGLNPETWRFQPEQPLQLMTSGVQDVFLVTTKRGREVTVTMNHRLLTPQGWRELKDIGVGDYLAVPMQLPSTKTPEYQEVSEDEAYLIGLLIGDGCLTRGMTLSAIDPGVISKFHALVASVFPKCKVSPGDGGRAHHVSGTSRSKKSPHLQWLTKLRLRNKKAQVKSVPREVFASGRPAILACLAGLMSTDGWYTSDGYGEFYSSSKKLIDDAQSLFVRAGVPTTKRMWINGGKEYWQISIVTHWGRSYFRNTVLPLCCRKVVKGPSTERSTRSSAFCLPPYAVDLFTQHDAKALYSWKRGKNQVGRQKFVESVRSLDSPSAELLRFTSEDVGWDIIKTIEPLGKTQTFDLSMPSEAFVCNDFIVHNSSAILALLMALSGRSGMDDYPEIALTEGQDEGWVTVHLSGETEETHQPGGMTVKLRLIRKRNGTVVEEFVIEDVDGDPAPAPRELLKQLFNLRAFDPLEFQRMKPKTRKELLEKLLGLDFSDDRVEYKRLFDKRTDLNREYKSLEAQVKGLPAYPECVETSAVDLMAELERRQAINQQNNTVRADAAQTEKLIDDASVRINDLNVQMEALRKRLDALTQSKSDLESMLANQKTAVAALVDADLDEVRTQITNADQNNQKARANARRNELSTKWQELGKRIDAIEESLEKIKTTNEKKLQEAKFPVEGMSLDAEGILLNGLPFDQASCAERIEASVRVGMALNPTLRLMVSQDGGALDDEAIVALDKILAENDFQMIVEVATRSPFDEDLCSVVLKDGKVAKVNAKKPTLFAEPEVAV